MTLTVTWNVPYSYWWHHDFKGFWGLRSKKKKKKKCYSAKHALTFLHYVTTGASIYISFSMSLLLNNFWISLRFFCTPGAIKTLHPAKCCPAFAPISEGVGGVSLGCCGLCSWRETKRMGCDPCARPHQSHTCTWAQVSKDKCGQRPRRGWVQFTLYSRGRLSLTHCRMSAV